MKRLLHRAILTAVLLSGLVVPASAQWFRRDTASVSKDTVNVRTETVQKQSKPWFVRETAPVNKDTVVVQTEPVQVPVAVVDTVSVIRDSLISVVADTIPERDTLKRSLFYLKANLLTYPLLCANLGAEMTFGKHFSVSVPVYYTALDWFQYNIKFRVLGTQPEFRWYLRDDFTGFFAAAHLTFSYYNIALGGKYRYQDHATVSPTLGGGINAGYRTVLGDTPWSLEFSLGAGFLPLYYDTFYNIRNGSYVEEGLRKSYFGPDHAAVTLCYRFGKKDKKEGRR